MSRHPRRPGGCTRRVPATCDAASASAGFRRAALERKKLEARKDHLLPVRLLGRDQGDASAIASVRASPSESLRDAACPRDPIVDLEEELVDEDGVRDLIQDEPVAYEADVAPAAMRRRRRPPPRPVLTAQPSTRPRSAEDTCGDDPRPSRRSSAAHVVAAAARAGDITGPALAQPERLRISKPRLALLDRIRGERHARVADPSTRRAPIADRGLDRPEERVPELGPTKVSGYGNLSRGSRTSGSRRHVTRLDGDLEVVESRGYRAGRTSSTRRLRRSASD